MKDFKIRCSAIGKIMGTGGIITPAQLTELQDLEAKEKLTKAQETKKAKLTAKRDNPQLSETAKSYCKEWVKEQLYSRRPQISSKFMDKGNIMEDESIDLIAEKFELGLLVKNEEFYENEYAHGTPDVVLNSHIIDVKNSWSCFTFPLFDEEVPNDDYYWQGQGYLWLVDRPRYELIYTLMDTPEHLIEKEFKWNNPLEKSAEVFKKEYLYSHLSPELRIKVFKFERNEADIERIKMHVDLCRKYINELLNKLN